MTDQWQLGILRLNRVASPVEPEAWWVVDGWNGPPEAAVQEEGGTEHWVGIVNRLGAHGWAYVEYRNTSGGSRTSVEVTLRRKIAAE